MCKRFWAQTKLYYCVIKQLNSRFVSMTLTNFRVLCFSETGIIFFIKHNFVLHIKEIFRNQIQFHSSFALLLKNADNKSCHPQVIYIRMQSILKLSLLTSIDNKTAVESVYCGINELKAFSLCLKEWTKCQTPSSS